jgi:hypothetical protein
MWELKETAKWSRDLDEKKDAIHKLSARGEEALPSLEEIRDITAYDDIRAACVEAIKSLRKEAEKGEKPGSKLADLPP